MFSFLKQIFLWLFFIEGFSVALFIIGGVALDALIIDGRDGFFNMYVRPLNVPIWFLISLGVILWNAISFFKNSDFIANLNTPSGWRANYQASVPVPPVRIFAVAIAAPVVGLLGFILISAMAG